VCITFFFNNLDFCIDRVIFDISYNQSISLFSISLLFLLYQTIPQIYTIFLIYFSLFSFSLTYFSLHKFFLEPSKALEQLEGFLSGPPAWSLSLFQFPCWSIASWHTHNYTWHHCVFLQQLCLHSFQGKLHFFTHIFFI
jgi:hypothetical protein